MEKKTNQNGGGESVQPNSFLDKIIYFCLKNKLLVLLMVIAIFLWGIMVAPFDWDIAGIPRYPVPVDAIPDIGENQQIVFTPWAGRSPQDVEDQVSYPLTVSLLGVPGVKTVRSFSMFGFSSVYVIFKEDIDFYWSRSRILEKLNSLPSGTLPERVQPALGPDATALGQIFWYTLEGRDEKGNVTGGWGLDELRSIQDWYVRYALLSAEGISEVASVGGHVKEYQVDVDPDAMLAYGVTLPEVFSAVKMSNADIGARTIEINRAEYVIRGVGFIKKIEDIENSVIKVRNNIPVYIRNIGKVQTGPALRRGALDKDGAEVVGGVAVVRYGENPLDAIKNLKKKIEEITPGLPKKTLSDGTVSRVRIVPFYDRTGLIHETLNTLNTALTEEILITVIVVILMLLNLKSSMLISGLLPLAVLLSFAAMKSFGVDANIVALSGIAIAIGTMVDMGIVFTENIVRHLKNAGPGESRLQVIFKASSEVGSAVVTAVMTTVVSFLPVFTMTAAEGKLFKPLAYTKTFALVASILVAVTIIPPVAHLLFRNTGIKKISTKKISGKFAERFRGTGNYLALLIVGIFLTQYWEPLGPEKGFPANFLFVSVLIGTVWYIFTRFIKYYTRILRWTLEHRKVFYTMVGGVVFLGVMSWLGFRSFFGWLPASILRLPPVSVVSHAFPGFGKEFMPPLDEGAFLFMPTTMPHASIGEALDVLRKQDIGFSGIPEIESAVGKLGRADTPLDPAPVSMIETVINYKSRFLHDTSGKQMQFKYDKGETDYFRDVEGKALPAGDGLPYRVKGKFNRDENGKLIPDSGGEPFPLWRKPLDPRLNPGREEWEGIQSPEDIWDVILQAAKIPGTTSAPKLQPISARLVMLQSGMRAPMGIKVKGPGLDVIEKVGIQIEKYLKEVPSIEASTVIADRIVGKPYLEIEIHRTAIARYGIPLKRVQDMIEVAVGGKRITTTVEGRERYPVRVRYMRELRNSMETIPEILIAAPDGTQIPLKQLSEIRYVRGPQVIKSEDTFLIGYVLFDKKKGFAEVDVVKDAEEYLNSKIRSGEFEIPPGVSYSFAGSYENQIRSEKTLLMILPLALFIIFIILFLQFRRVSTTFLVFSGIMVAWSGGFIMIWLYNQPWFLNFTLLGVNFQQLFQVDPMNLSVAVWVGFLALFGIASDDGVIIATYLNQTFKKRNPSTVEEIREATVEAGSRRVRPALMTTATTLLALMPILMSTGRGSDIMIPMAIPTFGGMSIALITLFIVPVSYSWLRERELNRKSAAVQIDSKNGNS